MTKTDIIKNNIEEILALYNKNYTFEQIIKTLNLQCSENLLGDYIRNTLNLKRIKNRQKSLIKDFEKDVIIPWINGKSLSQLGKELHTCPKQLSKHLKDLGYNIRSKSFEKLFDNTVFDVIDTEEKSYWLGFIFADGYIETNSNRFGIDLSIKDYGHLIKFNSFMKCQKNNIRTLINKQNYKGEIVNREMCSWRISDKHLKNSLIKLGCFEHKSLILEFPNIPKKYIKHFIRGYFDGDGCLSYYKHQHNIIPQCSILGTKQFITELSYYTNEDFSIQEVTNVNTYYNLKYNKQGSQNFLNFIYKDATIYLDRKYNRYKLFKKYNFEIPYTDQQLKEVFGILS